MGNTFGQVLRVTTFGESHGVAVGVVIDGVPPGREIDLAEVQKQLARRRPGQSDLTSPRGEPDIVECLSGLEDNITLGTPLTLMVRNHDMKKMDYDDMSGILRPSHADFTTLARFGIKSSSGGGRASARETIGRVAAAGIMEQILRRELPAFAVVAWVDTVAGVRCGQVTEDTISRAAVDASPVRCPVPSSAQEMTNIIIQAKAEGDSVGGIIRCVIRGVPAGLGDPVFDKLEADLAKGMMSLPATKGFEIGSGFAGTTLRGSTHNDPFVVREGRVRTATNHSGGIQGGISNGEMIHFNVAFKPVATIFKEQTTVDIHGEATTLKPKAGRHDPCVLPRAVPMVESMAVLVIADHWLRAAHVKGK